MSDAVVSCCGRLSYLDLRFIVTVFPLWLTEIVDLIATAENFFDDAQFCRFSPIVKVNFFDCGRQDLSEDFYRRVVFTNAHRQIFRANAPLSKRFEGFFDDSVFQRVKSYNGEASADFQTIDGFFQSVGQNV